MKRRIRFAVATRWGSRFRLALLRAVAWLQDTRVKAAQSAWATFAQFTFRRPRPCLAIQAAHPPRRIFWTVGTIICFFVPTEWSVAQTWAVTTAPSANRVSLASSADGNRLAALVEGGEAVYISTNAGAEWTLSSPANGGAVVPARALGPLAARLLSRHAGTGDNSSTDTCSVVYPRNSGDPYHPQ